MPRSRLALATAAVTLALAAPAAAAPGDYFVTEDSGFTDNKGGVIAVNPANGAQTEFSSNAVPGTGSPFNDGPFGLAVASNGDIFVADYRAGSGTTGAIIRIDPATGTPTVLSDNAVAANTGTVPRFSLLSNLVIGLGGDVFVTDDDANSVIRVNRTTGSHTLVTSGDNLDGPEGIVAAPNGDLFVGDFKAGGDDTGAIIKVDPTSGAQTVVSNNQISEAATGVAGSGRFEDPTGVALRPDGHLLVADLNAEVSTGALIDVNLSNGVQTLVSDNATAGASPKFSEPLQPRLAPNGDILVLDTTAETNGALLRINPTTGQHEVVSSNARSLAAAGGQFFEGPGDFATGPSPDVSGPGVTSAAGGSGGEASLADTVKPFFIGGALADPTTFAVNRAGRPEAPVKSRARRGTTFRFTLSEPSRVVFTIERRTRGRKVGRRCRKQTRKNRKRRSCSRFVVAGRFAAQGQLGVNGKSFSGRIGRRALRAGRYRASLVARDAAGNASGRKRIGFKVVRR